MTDNLSNDMFKMVVDSEGGAMEPSVVVDGFMDLVEVQACCCGKLAPSSHPHAHPHPHVSLLCNWLTELGSQGLCHDCDTAWNQLQVLRRQPNRQAVSHS